MPVRLIARGPTKTAFGRTSASKHFRLVIPGETNKTQLLKKLIARISLFYCQVGDRLSFKGIPSSLVETNKTHLLKKLIARMSLFFGLLIENLALWILAIKY
jgi:hypothetical protein